MDVSQPPAPSGGGGRRLGGTIVLAATLWVGSAAALIRAIWAPVSTLFR